VGDVSKYIAPQVGMVAGLPGRTLIDDLLPV
jgi:hypothetical protein